MPDKKNFHELHPIEQIVKLIGMLAVAAVPSFALATWYIDQRIHDSADLEKIKDYMLIISDTVLPYQIAREKRQRSAMLKHRATNPESWGSEEEEALTEKTERIQKLIKQEEQFKYIKW